MDTGGRVKAILVKALLVDPELVRDDALLVDGTARHHVCNSVELRHDKSRVSDQGQARADFKAAQGDPPRVCGAQGS